MRAKRTNAGLVAGLLSIAPLLLAPKGCDALVGRERKCGGLAGTSCPQGEFCDFSPGAMCGAADRSGLCRLIPGECSRSEERRVGKARGSRRAPESSK